MENGVCFIDRKSCAVECIDVAIDTSISSNHSIFIQIIRSAIDRHANGQHTDNTHSLSVSSFLYLSLVLIFIRPRFGHLFPLDR